jgi:hypothetical protein
MLDCHKHTSKVDGTASAVLILSVNVRADQRSSALFPFPVLPTPNVVDLAFAPPLLSLLVASACCLMGAIGFIVR